MCMCKLQTYCPQFCGNQTHRLYYWNSAEHLCFVNFCIISCRTLDRFSLERSWMATAADIWNRLPADVIIQGEVSSWRTILKDVQCCIRLTCIQPYFISLSLLHYPMHQGSAKKAEACIQQRVSHPIWSPTTAGPCTGPSRAIFVALGGPPELYGRLWYCCYPVSLYYKFDRYCLCC